MQTNASQNRGGARAGNGMGKGAVNKEEEEEE